MSNRLDMLFAPLLPFAVATVTLVNSPAWPQYFMQDRSTSALGIAGDFSISDAGEELEMALTIHHHGIVDFGVGLSRGRLNDNDLAYKGFRPQFSYHPVESDRTPLNMSFYTSYGFFRYSGDRLDDFGISLDGRAWTLGAKFGVVIEAERIKVLPNIGFENEKKKWRRSCAYSNSYENFAGDRVCTPPSQSNWSSVKDELDANRGPLRPPLSPLTSEAVDNFTTISIAMTIAFPPNKNGQVFYFTPSVDVSEESTSFSVNLGLLFAPRNNRGKQKPTRQGETGRRITEIPSPSSPAMPPPIPVPARVDPTKPGTLPSSVILSLTQGVPENTAVRVTPQDAEHAESLAQVFKVTPESIRTFRWGNSTAGPGHPHHQTTWFVIEYGDGDYRARETIRIDASGGIIEHVKE